MTRRVLWVLACCAVLSACTATVAGAGHRAAGSSVPAHATGGAPAAPADWAALLPGEYALAGLNATAHGRQVSIDAPLPCPAVIDQLQAGQWAVRVFGRPNQVLKVYAAIMSYGDTLAMLVLNDAPGRCSGSIDVETSQPVTATGALTASGPAQALPFYCQVTADVNGNDPKALNLVYVGLYRAHGAAFILLVQAPATKGTHQLSADDQGDQGLSVLPISPKVSPVDAIIAFFGGAFTGTGYGDSMPPGVTAAYAGGGTIAVTGTGPLVATVTGPKLTDQEHPGPAIALTAGVRCDS